MSKLSFTQHRRFSGVLPTQTKFQTQGKSPQNYHILCINCFIPLNDPCFLQSFFFLFLPFCEAIDLTKVVIPKGSNSSTGPTTTPPGFSKVHARNSRNLLARKIFLVPMMETCVVSPDFNCAILERSCHRVHLGLKLLESGSWLHGWLPAFEPSGLETSRRKNNFGSNKMS